MQRPQGQQIGVAGTGAHDLHLPLGRNIVTRALDFNEEGRFRLGLAACEKQRSDRAVDDLFPESAGRKTS